MVRELLRMAEQAREDGYDVHYLDHEICPAAFEERFYELAEKELLKSEQALEEDKCNFGCVIRDASLKEFWMNYQSVFFCVLIAIGQCTGRLITRRKTNVYNSLHCSNGANTRPSASL